MILATVGTQLPFDRLLRALDAWAARNPDQRVRAQSGNSQEVFKNMDCTAFLSPAAYAGAVEEADIIVSHAGMGSILTAAELGKPIVILPRLAAHGEHRTDHQLATAAEMASLANVTVIESAEELGPALDRLSGAPTLPAAERISASADAGLIGAVAHFLRGAA
ncbi:glycosyltransferase [Aliiruegeria lutimaris]|uniref:UDP-N-acetylglucosamine transferase subunit ALG13 n=1 Tax=Aliiruegeria lutimaris TaxID=571298 RepID=A0A1G8WM33_9RHOB|nr:glycosyltransferase [Aliiruegeria lutimaris]SDJ79448.1 UDP-N-acetylglucosamine transferase subunit ALG13 [Aliiruegeria lutimaris]